MSDTLVQAQFLDKNPEFVAALLDTSSNLILVLDCSGTIVCFNRACEEITGYGTSEVLGHCLFDIFLRPDDKESKQEAFEMICSNPAQAMQMNEAEVVWLDKKGAELYVEWKYTALGDAMGRVRYIVSVGAEVSRQRCTERALRESEERYSLALQGAKDGIWDWNLETDEVYFSPRWKAMLDYQDGEIGSSIEDWFNRVHPADSEGLKEAIQHHLDGKTPHLECEYRILHQDETYRWMLARGLAVRDENGKLHRMAGSQTDMTERKVAEHQLLHDAFHDALTGLPNRVVFLERVEQMIARAQRRDDYCFAVLFLDLNNFKTVNDTLGHLVGDQLLKAVASRLKQCLRRDDTIAREAPQVHPPFHPPFHTLLDKALNPDMRSSSGALSDMVARLGGDEFTIVLEDVSGVGEARAVAQRIYEEIECPFNINGQIVNASVSIGIVLSSGAHQTPDELVAQADVAMYKAKEKSRSDGQSQTCVFEAGSV